MVLQTRKIVEDFVLYKIHSMVTGAESQAIERALNVKSAVEPSNNELLLVIRQVGDEYESRYKQTFPDLMEQLRSANISSEDVGRIFRKISTELFQLSAKKTINENRLIRIKWGHVIGLLVFAGLLAVRAVELHCPEQVDDIIKWVTDFLNTELSEWLEARGGWEDVINYADELRHGNVSVEPAEDEDNQGVSTTGIQSVMGVGVLAACVGIGAIFFSRK